MDELLQILGVGGSGLLSGALLGYGVKKLMKVVVMIIMIELTFLKSLETTGFITNVRWDRIYDALAGINIGQYSPEPLMNNFGLLSGSSGFVAGVALGFKHG